jgi:hypothetical protein
MRIKECQVGMKVKSNLKDFIYTVTKVRMESIDVRYDDAAGPIDYKGLSPLIFTEVKQ